MSEFKPTEEQSLARTCAMDLQPGEIMTVNAYAGTGKTTTVKFIANSLPTLRTLYISFNRDMAEEAKHIFPTHVECRTTHSLAYKSFGARFRHKLGNTRPYAIARAFRISEHEASAAAEAVRRFLYSGDDAITNDHVEEATGERDNDVLRLAERLWLGMADPKNTELAIPHDGYLKLWVLSRPPCPFDLVLVDEAQDLNPVTLKLLLDWQALGARLGFVGDTHQSIYGFRLAVDAMSQVSAIAAAKSSLTESWRFPQSVADCASKILSTLKGDNVRLYGRGKHQGTGKQTRCFISRRNGTLIKAALSELSPGSGVHFAGTTKEKGWSPFEPYRFQEILDTFYLMAGTRGRIVNPHIGRFATYEDLKKAAIGDEGDGDNKPESPRDPELSPLVSLVEFYGMDTPRVLKRLEDASVGPEDTHKHFSTGHRAKGKQWAHVTLLSGFLPLDDAAKMKELKSKMSAREWSEEINLIYVAVTRCQRDYIPYPEAQLFLQGNTPAITTAAEMLRSA